MHLSKGEGGEEEDQGYRSILPTTSIVSAETIVAPPSPSCSVDSPPPPPPSPADGPSPPPDGGYGWVVVIAQFFVNGFTWGVVASYSVYLAYYLTHDIFADGGPIDFAFIGGFNFAFAMLISPVATLLARVMGARGPMFVGVFLLSAGFVAASFATKIWHLYLSQGVCIGSGVGLIYLPATAMIPQWFSKKRSLANGICSAGSGIGGLTVCFATEGMLDTVGLKWSLRITAIFVFFINFVATLLIRSRNDDIQPIQKLFKFELLRNYHVDLLLLWSFVVMFGYITLMFSLSDYTLVIGRSNSDAATVAAILNLGAAIGRPWIGFISDKFGRVETAGVLTFLCGILVFALWIPGTVYGVLLVFALLSGAILGTFWAVIGPLATEIAGLKELPSLLSLTWLTVVLPSTFAEVIALYLRRPGRGAQTYLHPQIFAGTSYIVASLFLLELWRSRRAVRRLGNGTHGHAPSHQDQE